MLAADNAAVMKAGRINLIGSSPCSTVLSDICRRQAAGSQGKKKSRRAMRGGAIRRIY
jgi:hypothetical protein